MFNILIVCDYQKATTMDQNNGIHGRLYGAVRSGNLEKVRDIISSVSLSFSPSWANGYVLLREAIKYNHKEIAKFLLNEGSRVNSKNKNSCDTALHFAVLNNHSDLVELLLNRNADVNLSNHSRKIPLHLAVTRGNQEICQLLLRKNSDPNFSDSNGYHPLHIAAKHGLLEIAKELIKYGSCVNLSVTSIYTQGYTPLHFATCNGNGEIVKLLLQSGANANSKDKDDSSSLHIAALKGHLEIAKDLIMHGASVNSLSTLHIKEERLPLHCAVFKGHGEIVKLLLQSDADANSKDEDGSTSLHLAVKKGCLEIAKDLIMHGACVNSPLTSSPEEGYTPLHVASCNENEVVVKLLIDNGAIINATAKNDLKPLHIAVQNKRQKVVPLLLGHGAEVDSKDKDGKTPLYFAAIGGCLEIIQEILKYCPDVNVKSNKLAFNSAIYKEREITENFLDYGFRIDPEDANDSKLLQVSVEKGLTKIVEDLLHFGADINIPYEEKWKKGYTLLHTAARKGHGDIARVLIGYGASVNSKDEAGRTPMYYSIGRGSIEICKLLLASGANVNDVFEPPNSLFNYNDHRNSQVISAGETALHLATMQGNKELAELFICKGANVNAVKKDGSTALHTAVIGSHEEIVELLLEHNANVNAMDKSVLSPLHLASTNKKVTIVKSLLEYGADVNCKDSLEETALHHFCRYKHLEGVKALLDYGADINATNNNGSTALNIALSCIESYAIVISGSVVIVKFIIMQIVKVLAAKMHVSHKNLTFDTLSPLPFERHGTLCCNKSHFLHFKRMCEKEMQEMKNQKISGNISFCDLLIKNLDQVAAYWRNENISQVLDSGEYITKFPIYAEMLEMRILRGKRRNELFECASKALNYCSKSILPYPVTQKILLYLGEKGLITLTKFYVQYFDSSDTKIRESKTEVAYFLKYCSMI